jgi:ApaG protein
VSPQVAVRVRSEYLAGQSQPQAERWLFAYHVEIHNLGQEPVQLLSRHWIITNGNGAVDEVRGPGVVGLQPVIEPGEHFAYSSGCPLDTPVGTMHGSYEMQVVATGEQFKAAIAPFRLAVPGALN